jgi:hypothetical protein
MNNQSGQADRRGRDDDALWSVAGGCLSSRTTTTTLRVDFLCGHSLKKVGPDEQSAGIGVPNKKHERSSGRRGRTNCLHHHYHGRQQQQRRRRKKNMLLERPHCLRMRAEPAPGKQDNTRRGLLRGSAG